MARERVESWVDIGGSSEMLHHTVRPGPAPFAFRFAAAPGASREHRLKLLSFNLRKFHMPGQRNAVLDD
jgi:hypothetical protein